MHCELCCRLSVSLHRDFPNFYRKLYNLLEPSVLHAKYRARFFHLADLFLSSRSDHDTVIERPNGRKFPPTLPLTCNDSKCLHSIKPGQSVHRAFFLDSIKLMCLCVHVQSLASIFGGSICQTAGTAGPHGPAHRPPHRAALHLQPVAPPPVLQTPPTQARHGGW